MKRVLVLSFAAAFVGIGLAGCGGGGSEIVNNSSTMGEELMDLKQAHESGVISDKEYERAKRKILKGR